MISTQVSSSVENSVKEAEKFGASPEEAKRIHNLVMENTSPGIIKSFELKFGPDSTNNRAVWVHLIVDEDLQPSKDKILRLNEIAQQVRSVLLSKNLNFWPYVDFRGRRGEPSS